MRITHRAVILPMAISPPRRILPRRPNLPHRSSLPRRPKLRRQVATPVTIRRTPPTNSPSKPPSLRLRFPITSSRPLPATITSGLPDIGIMPARVTIGCPARGCWRLTSVRSGLRLGGAMTTALTIGIVDTGRSTSATTAASITASDTRAADITEPIGIADISITTAPLPT
jgi:hypothetical protein